MNGIDSYSNNEIQKIKKAIEKIGTYGISTKDEFMIFRDEENNLYIAPKGRLDDILWERGFVNICSFISIDDLLNEHTSQMTIIHFGKTKIKKNQRLFKLTNGEEDAH